jgi:hypothetical protein
MVASNLSEIPEPDARDRIHKLMTELVSVSPIGIPYASELIAAIIKPSHENRMREWLQTLAEALIKLQDERDNFRIEALSRNDSFVTAVLQLTAIAISNHETERLETLRNAALNSALPVAPDSIRQRMFIQWLQELTPWHWKILRLFGTAEIPYLDIESEKWMINAHLGTGIK